MRFVGAMITTTALLSCIAADGSVPEPASDPTASVPVLARELDPQTLSECYPAASKFFGEEASLLVVLQISESGSASILELPPGTSATMQQAAECVVGQLRFLPAMRSGLPVPYKVAMPLNFSLEDTQGRTLDETADPASWLTEMLFDDGVDDHAVMLAGQLANGSPVAQRIMREDPAWASQLKAEFHSRLRRTYTAEELRSIAGFFASPVGQQWKRTRADSMIETASAQAKRQVLVSACVAAVVARQAEGSGFGRPAPGSGDGGTARLVDRLGPGVESDATQACECAVQQSLGTPGDVASAELKPPADMSMLQFLESVMDGERCPRPEGQFGAK